MKCIIVILMALLLTGCGAPSTTKLDGVYRANDGKSTLVFSADGKVKSHDLSGKEIETTYVIDGNKVSFLFPNGLPLSYTINSDGSLSAPSFSGYKKT